MKPSCGDYGTLSFFRNRLSRLAVSKDPKKNVNASLDFLDTVVTGHWLACACDVLGVSGLDDSLSLSPKLTAKEKQAFLESVARQIVDRLSVVESSFLACGTDDTSDQVYNYARVLCHYGSLAMEFRDAWAEGDGERIVRCWKLIMPHFRASLEALRLQFHVNAVLSPNLAHQVKWHRFVNTKGGPGKNIPCDLYNEHMNRLIKEIIANMGSNLTEGALQRAVRSVSYLEKMTDNFDRVSNVPHRTSAHSSRSDIADIKKVMKVVKSRKLLQVIGSREHTSIHFNPLHTWDAEKTKKWIKTHETKYSIKHRRMHRSRMEEI
jgi:hypothetical protein